MSKSKQKKGKGKGKGLKSSELYFAYGSNLNQRQMAERCPTAVPVGIGRMVGWVFGYTKSNRTFTNAFGNIHYTGNDEDIVYGLVYEMYKKDWDKLHSYEGYVGNTRLNHYNREVVDPLQFQWENQLAAEGYNKKSIYTYIATPMYTVDGLNPTTRYRGVVVGGAVHSGLPTDYIRSVLLEG